jgi:hypothetical protein
MAAFHPTRGVGGPDCQAFAEADLIAVVFGARQLALGPAKPVE